MFTKNIKKNTSNKKGQAPVINNLGLFAILLVVAGVTIAIGAQVLSTTQTALQTTTTNTLVNITILATDGAGTSLTVTNIVSGSDVAYNSSQASGNASQIQNPSNANYTLNTGTGIVVWVGASPFNGTNVNFTVDFQSVDNSTTLNVTNNALSSMNQLSSFLPTIGIVLAAVIILGLLGFLIFRRGR